MNILYGQISYIKSFHPVLKVKNQVKSNKPILHQIYQNYENLLHERAILTTMETASPESTPKKLSPPCYQEAFATMLSLGH